MTETVFAEEGGRSVAVEDCDGTVRLTITDGEQSMTATIAHCRWIRIAAAVKPKPVADDTSASRKSGERSTGSAPAPPAQPTHPIITTLTLTTEQANYLRDLRRRETNFDPSVVIGGPRPRDPWRTWRGLGRGMFIAGAAAGVTPNRKTKP